MIETARAAAPLPHRQASGAVQRPVVLVGLMGAGKTTVGRKLAQMLDLPFVDTDQEIEDASRMTISELFATYGEAEFRALEARVVARLLDDGPRIVATGGGAYMNEGTRRLLAERSITVWLKAELDVLMDRVMKKPTRPLLQTPDPRATLKALMDVRYPVYALADLHVPTRNVKREAVAREILDQLERHPHFKA
ncbi:shikimate kinase [Aureimonas phyllosphaerae]|uniref:Shikimate kinase n=1 Tax=Aureimonas phyllosphaerae TaxID=1166078 RepID=A0A7W6BVR7_9HYPH|nr:shikimate kinase [Aureimonas phyllosphaerae]MBB3935983.1 shikimate kinase [Aureimonas phyllosphaerae]MBB3960292.1 shikimate kinase [Aureimonas phyllosphaerae]SFF36044.1 shikimate kinase [Aureimonas phyllosphaerae]